MDEYGALWDGDVGSIAAIHKIGHLSDPWSLPMDSPSLIDHPQVLRILFHPRSEQGYPPTQAAIELCFPIDEQVSLGGRLYRSQNVRGPLLLYWHGNGEIAADYDDLSTFYTDMGIHFLVVDFRGYGLSTSSPSGSALLNDAVAVVDGLKGEVETHCPGVTDNLFVMGRSMGSAAAIEIAFRRPEKIKGLILESAFAYTVELIERLGGVSLDGTTEAAGFKSLEKMRSVQTPSLLIHGQEDVLIPVSDSQALFDACPAADKKIVRIDHAGHNDLMLQGMQLYFESIGRFVANIYQL
ncbi:MAG: alpha/beta hydrolase fold protein [Magnetococcales bacterium]|nr:alpha/beta hydrolase fold protein [Magnetococcales bacterium]